MIIVADSGSTKTDWKVIRDGKVDFGYQTDGINPYLLDLDQIENIASHDDVEEIREQVMEVNFYGAGCSRKDKQEQVQKALRKVFPMSKVTVMSDMFGAARGLCGFNTGIVCVLGTGSNACVYDGSEIVENSVSLGYLLGDEGSGVYIGQKLLQQYLYGRLPDSLKEKFKQKFPSISKEEVLDKLYSQYMPNKYMASFSEFASDHMDHPYIYGLLYESFYRFLDYHVRPLENSDSLSLNFVGSIAKCYESILEKVTVESGLSFGKVKRTPLDGLISYHLYNKD